MESSGHDARGEEGLEWSNDHGLEHARHELAENAREETGAPNVCIGGGNIVVSARRGSGRLLLVIVRLVSLFRRKAGLSIGCVNLCGACARDKKDCGDQHW